MQQFKYFRTIIEYQIAWLSTTYDMPGLTWEILTKNYPELTKDTALRIIDYWIAYEERRGISAVSKSIFDTDSNATIILKLKELLKEIDATLANVSKLKTKEKTPDTKQPSLVRLEKSGNEYSIVLSIGKKRWFKTDEIVISVNEAKKLMAELNQVISAIPTT